MNGRDEALVRALGELSILREVVTWLMGYEATKSDDPDGFLRNASAQITQTIAKLPSEVSPTVQEGFDRLLATALVQARAQKSQPPTA